MDELLAQFLIESRELLDAAVENLLALEKAPYAAASFDDVFRAFHTLKGGAGIVEFAPMERAMHAAESLLSAARAGSRPLSGRDVGDCLLCLDRVSEWLDVLESTGALPAAANAEDLLARLRRDSEDSARALQAKGETRDGWLPRLLAAQPAAAATACTAVRFEPDADSFFRDEDPLAIITALPRLLAIGVELRAPETRLDALDPFACQLVLTALAGAPPAAVVTELGDTAGRCDLVSLAPAVEAAHGVPLTRAARELLEAQLAMLDEVTDPHETSRIAAAGAVAANVLRRAGQDAYAESLAAAAAASAQNADAGRLRREIAALLGGAPARVPADPHTDQTGARDTRPQDTRAQTVRVSADRIDALVRLVGELTIASNAIGHSVALTEGGGAAALKNEHAGLDRLVRDLQRVALGMRVLPLRAAFQRLPRLVRELAAELRKPATLMLEGETTEADKAIVEAIGEPLVHVLRNAMDHGVEDTGTRAAAGKPVIATIYLRASRQGEHVVIEVTDDGAGIDVAAIRAAARRRNLLPVEELATLSDEDAIDLIFLPGFSTARNVTEVSGRGIGMDAVRTAVTRVGGRVEVASERGKGTTIRFVLPFSIMLTQVMTVEAGGQAFAIPLDAVVETIRVPRERIFAVGAAQAIVLHEETLPLVRLASVLGNDSGERAGAGAPLVIARFGSELGALEVDRVGDRMDVMLKPLDGLLSGMPGIAGSTLLGDGSVMLVLDVAGLLR